MNTLHVGGEYDGREMARAQAGYTLCEGMLCLPEPMGQMEKGARMASLYVAWDNGEWAKRQRKIKSRAKWWKGHLHCNLGCKKCCPTSRLRIAGR